MIENDLRTYETIRSGGTGFITMPRGLIAVWGKEAVQFLDGMITNDMKTLGDGQQMLAAFPNAHGRLLAAVRIMRQGDRFLIDTEEATREKVFNNLFRFTFAGDFFVEDLSEKYRYFEMFGKPAATAVADEFLFTEGRSNGRFAAVEAADEFSRGHIQITEELYEVLRIESSIPKYGVDMDETTIVPELGLDGMISYTKGCYIGQEIIARIHFRGHVAKKLGGVLLEPEAAELAAGSELQSIDGKNAGRIASVTFSPRFGKPIALAYVRYDFLERGTVLSADGLAAEVTSLPFI